MNSITNSAKFALLDTDSGYNSVENESCPYDSVGAGAQPNIQKSVTEPVFASAVHTMNCNRKNWLRECPYTEEIPEIPLTLPTFSGVKEESIELHFSKLEKIFQFAKTEKVRLVGLSLEGDALQCFDSINDTDYKSVKSHLIKRFSTEPIDILIWKKLHDKKQLANQNVHDFYFEVRKLGSKLGLKDKTMELIFQMGLKSDIRKHVLLQSPKNLEESYKVSALYEALQCLDVDGDDKTGLHKETQGSQLWTERNYNIREKHKSGERAQNNSRSQGKYHRTNGDGYWSAFRKSRRQNSGTRNNGNHFRNSNQKYNSRYGNFQSKNGVGRGSHYGPKNSRYNFAPSGPTAACQTDWRKPHIGQGQTGNGGQGSTQQGSCNAIRASLGKRQHRDRVLQEVQEYFGTEMLLSAKIQHFRVKALLDTGSNVGIINESCLKKLEPQPKIMESPYRSIVSANMSESPVKGCINVPIVIGQLKMDVELNILQGCNYDVILGRNFINENVKSINVGAREVLFLNDKGEVRKAELLSRQKRIGTFMKGKTAAIFTSASLSSSKESVYERLMSKEKRDHRQKVKVEILEYFRNMKAQELRQLNLECNQMSEVIGHTRNVLASKAEEVDSLRSQIADANIGVEDSVEELRLLERIIEKSSEESDKMQVELKSRNDECNEWIRASAEIQDRYQEAMTEVAKYADDVTDVQSLMDAMESIANANKIHENSVQALRDENAKLKADLLRCIRFSQL